MLSKRKALAERLTVSTSATQRRRADETSAGGRTRTAFMSTFPSTLALRTGGARESGARPQVAFKRLISQPAPAVAAWREHASKERTNDGGAIHHNLEALMSLQRKEGVLLEKYRQAGRHVRRRPTGWKLHAVLGGAPPCTEAFADAPRSGASPS